jgi:predicted oxidoreductase
MSPIVAGVWRMASWGMTPAERVRWIESCLDAGITTFDHADIYGDYTVEGLFGEALALHPSLRSRMQIVTKCGIKLVSPARPMHTVKSYDTSHAHVVTSVEQSLRELRTDVLDVLLIHRPDPLLEPAALAETFQSLRQRGLVRAFGVSNFSPSQFALLQQYVPLVTNQVELHPLAPAVLHDGTLDQALALGLRPMIWSPLAGGRLLTGTDAAALRARAVLQSIADVHGVRVATIAYAWVLMHPSRPLPITGSRRVDALQDAVTARNIALSRDDWFRILEAGTGVEVP